MTAAINKLLANYFEADRAIKEALRTDSTKLLEESFAEIFARNPGLKRFAYIGWTPGFNDGEPCTHSGGCLLGIVRKQPSWKNDGTFYYTTDIEDYTSGGDLNEFFEIGVEDGKPIDNETDPMHSVNKDCANPKQAENDIAALENIIERVFETNYIIRVSLNPDASVTIERDSYDCGY